MQLLISIPLYSGRCLASGGSCGYIDRTAQQLQSPRPSDGSITPKIEELEFWEEIPDYLSLPQHMLSKFPVDVSTDHSDLFDICKSATPTCMKI